MIGRLLSYVFHYKKRLICVLFCMLFSTGASLAGSYMVRPLINAIADGATPAADRIAYMLATIGVLAGVYLIGVAATYLQSRLMISVSQNSIEKIRNDLFDKLQGLPVRFYDNESKMCIRDSVHAASSAVNCGWKWSGMSKPSAAASSSDSGSCVSPRVRSVIGCVEETVAMMTGVSR